MDEIFCVQKERSSKISKKGILKLKDEDSKIYFFIFLFFLKKLFIATLKNKRAENEKIDEMEIEEGNS